MTIRLFKDNAKTCHIEWYKKAASEVFAFNDMVAINTSGYVTKYTDGGAYPLLGLVQKAITATSSDYASNTKIPVLVCGTDAEYLCDVTTGSAAQTNVGEFIDVDGAVDAAKGVDVTSSANNDFYVTQVLSATLLVAKNSRQFGRVEE